MKYFERIKYNKVPNKVTHHIYIKTMFYKLLVVDRALCINYFITPTSALYINTLKTC